MIIRYLDPWGMNPTILVPTLVVPERRIKIN